MRLLGVATGDLARLEVGVPAAREERRGAGVLVDLDDRGDDPRQEGPVVRDHDEAAASPLQEGLEAFEAVEVEVVGGLVEQHDVVARQQERREGDPGRLAPGEGRHLEREQRGLEAEVGGDRGAARLEVGAAEGEVVLERERVPVVGARAAVGERLGRGAERGLGLGHAGLAGEEGRDGLAGEPLALLGEVADGRLRRRGRDLAGVGRLEAGEDPEQGRLADAVRPDDAEARLGRDGEVDAVEDELGAPVLAEAPSDEGGDASGRQRDGRDGAAAGVAWRTGGAGWRHAVPLGGRAAVGVEEGITCAPRHHSSTTKPTGAAAVGPSRGAPGTLAGRRGVGLATIG